MNPERFQDVKRIFQEARERPQSEWPSFLDTACGADGSLRLEVESLLRSAEAEEAARFLETGGSPAPATLTQHAAEGIADPFQPGRHLGPYRIVERIGKGGMGTIHLAVRDDDEYRKRVAIKVLRRGFESDDLLRRFRRERQILASLDHENIAKLLDGGTTDGGLPYLVMEYIDGVPIDEYCDAHRLSIRERLELFRHVCAAVHVAHQNLVVHRDLKPSNVLVTAKGVPKLLDFGIAKLLNPELSSDTVDPTRADLRLMTPDYASPEQARGGTVTTATDVYSLGVLLYEILTGHRPFRITNRNLHDMNRIICEQEPTRPSTVVGEVVELIDADGSTFLLSPEVVSRTREGEPQKLRRRLAGDLDNIVMMALRKEPQRRYGSVEQFSEDVKRHLSGLPVMARKDTFTYRASKFAGRHKLGLAAATAFVAAVTTSAVAMGIQSVRLARERDRAEQVTELLVEIFANSDPVQRSGETITAREILDRGAERVKTGVTLQPLLRAALFDTIGRVYHNLGLYDRAEPLLKQALDLRVGELGEASLEAAQSQTHLGLLYTDESKFQEAEPLLRKALATRETKLGRRHKDVAASLNNVAFLIEETGAYAESEALYRRGLEVARSLPETERVVEDSLLSNLGALLYKRGDYAAAEPYYQEALALRRERYGSEHLQVALSLNNLGALYAARREYARGEPLYREAVGIRQKILGAGHPSTLIALNNLANLLREKGDLSEAETLYREVLATRRKALPPGHQSVAYSLVGLGRLLISTGKYPEAEVLLREAVTIEEAKLPPGHWEIAYVRGVLGGALLGQNRSDEAKTVLEESLRILKEKRGESDERTREIERYLERTKKTG